MSAFADDGVFKTDEKYGSKTLPVLEEGDSESNFIFNYNDTSQDIQIRRLDKEYTANRSLSRGSGMSIFLIYYSAPLGRVLVRFASFEEKTCSPGVCRSE